MTRLAALVVFATMFGACSPAPVPSGSAPAAPTPAQAIELPPKTHSSLEVVDVATCAPTAPVTAPDAIGDRLFGYASASGNEALWVGGLGEGGVIEADDRFVEPDGAIGWKLGWWRIEPGSLTITGRRLDARAPALRASVPDGYGREGFQASGVSFPTDGCWEVTGTVGDASLTFVTFVVRD